MTAPIDRTPVVTVENKTAAHGQSFAASSLFTASDPDGECITEYDFWDTGVVVGISCSNNQPLGANQDNYISAAQIAHTTYQSGSGADTLWVRVSDGALWSAWSQSFTVTAPIDTGPLVVPVSTNISATHDQSFAVSTLFLASDPFGDAITEYDFWDTGTGGGHFLRNNQALGANQDNYVSAEQLAQTTYQSGSGADTLWVRVSDGSKWSPWSQSFTVTAPVDTGPVVNSVTSILTTAGQIFATSALFTTSDPFGDAIEQYDFWDTGAGGGHFAINGRPLAANQDNIISASQLGQTGYVAGSGTDTLWVRVSEGGQWSPWSPNFTVSDPTTIGANETLELSSGYSGQISFAASLSGGQRQRVAIARALIGDPRILIFDEATSALDYESERVIQQNMSEIAKGRTVFIIAHRLSTVRMADRIITIDRGRLVEDGTHDQLVRTGGRYASLCRLQGGMIHEAS